MEGKILDMTNPMFKEEQTSRKINTVVEELNKNPFGAQVMLLFLVAVGVGLSQGSLPRLVAKVLSPLPTPGPVPRGYAAQLLVRLDHVVIAGRFEKI